MTRLKIALLSTAVAAAVLTAGNADAQTVLSTTASGTFYAFPAVNYVGPGPQTVAPGITWSSTNAANQGGSVFGYNGGYGFGGNGFAQDTLVGLNDSTEAYGVTDTMRFDFATPVSSVGAVLNWVRSGSPVTIAAYDPTGLLLSSYVLSAGGANIATPNSYYGFTGPTANIASFRLTDGYVAALRGLNIAGLNAVPEPATWAMMLAGFGAMGFALRRARRTVRITYA